MQAAGFEGDVRKQEDAKRVLESTFKHFGRIDILVNAAAGNFLVSPEDLSPNGFRTGFYNLFHSIFAILDYCRELNLPKELQRQLKDFVFKAFLKWVSFGCSYTLTRLIFFFPFMLKPQEMYILKKKKQPCNAFY